MSSKADGVIIYCDEENAKAGKKLMDWLQLKPEDDPDIYLGLDLETGEITGPTVRMGQRYRIIYTSPVRLPFRLSSGEEGVFHVAEITGTLSGSAPQTSRLLEVELVACQPDDYSIKQHIKSDKSLFRFFLGDRLEEAKRITKDEIASQITKPEWLCDLVAKYLSAHLYPICQYYYYHSEGTRLLDPDYQDEKKIEYYPSKGILLEQVGSSGGPPYAFSVRTIEQTFLLETGQFATVNSTFSHATYQSSGFHDSDITDRTTSEMRIWTEDEIRQNQDKLTQMLLSRLTQANNGDE